MKANHPLLITSLGIALLSSGCVGTGPNTQQGAVAGGALGALAGAIIGNNSGSHNAGQGALIGALAGAVVGGTLGNAADHERGTLYTSERQATTTYYVARPPAPPYQPTEVIVAQPAPNTVWVAGHYLYTPESNYVWVPGYWQAPPRYCRVFVAPHWAYRRGRYVYVQGYWRG